VHQTTFRAFVSEEVKRNALDVNLVLGVQSWTMLAGLPEHGGRFPESGASTHRALQLPPYILRVCLLLHKITFTTKLNSEPACHHPEKTPVVQLLMNFQAFYGTQRFITMLTRVPHWSLSTARSIQSISPPPRPFMKFRNKILR
jgi:hypothetical protein